MHPACWDIFLQNHAVLATRNPFTPNLNLLGEIFANQELEGDGQGLQPDWSKDYAGPNLFYSDGWAYHEDLEASEVWGVLEESDKWDFLVYDPETVTGIEEILNNPPLLQSGLQTRETSLTAKEDHLFSRLPQEILQGILCLLPTSSVQAVRLASRVMAAIPLTFSYWRSRFEFPNELSRIELPQALFPSQMNGQVVDWKSLCQQLLRPVGEQYKWWENRKRISTLTKRLAQRLLSESTAQVSKGQEQAVGKKVWYVVASLRVPGKMPPTTYQQFLETGLLQEPKNSSWSPSVPGCHGKRWLE